MFQLFKSIHVLSVLAVLLLSSCIPGKKGQYSIIGERLYKQDKTAPNVVSFYPVHQELNADVSSNLVITLDDIVRVNSTLALTDTIFIRLVSDDSLFAAYNFSDSEVMVSDKTITIDPSSDLDFNTSYYVEISANAVENLMSLGFAGITGNSTWQFKTEVAAAPSLVIGVVSGATTEAGGTATFTVKLAVAPATDVVLDITSNDLGEGTVSPATLTFTSANWNTNQTVTVTGVDDSIIDGNNSYNVTVAVDDGNSDDDYDAVADSTVAITNNDGDSGSLVIGAISGATSETGTTATFTVKLGAGPSSDVVLNITSTDLGEGTVSPATLTFTSANWNTNQTVTVTGVDDSIIDGSISYNVTVSVNDGSSNDSYDSVSDSQVSVTNNDDDIGSLVVSAISGVTNEAGTTATFTVKLGAGPSSNVVLNISSTDTGEGTVSPATLTFTSANWNTNQTVTVTGVDDGIIDGNITYDVTASVNDGSSNDAYDGVADSLVSVTNNDNDVASLVVGAISGATTEAGGTATFTVKLGAGPASDVVLDITSNDLGEGTVSPATLTFTSANWNTNQTVTVTGVDDFIIDGNISYNVTVAVDDGSSDDDYDGVVDSTVAITSNDNDSGSFVIGAVSGNTTEIGGMATFTVKLGAGPSSDVVLNITSTDLTEGTVSPATLTFTSANWNTNQTVTVTGVDDSIIDGNISYNVTVAVNDGSSNDSYDSVSDSQVSVTNNDNDDASLIVSAISGVTSESATAATFTVKLGAGPTSDVVLDIYSTDTGEGTVSPSTLTFTSANWNTNQTVTVTGVDDGIIDGNITFDVTVAVDDGNSNDSYDAVVDSLVSVTNNDNDVASLVVGAISGATTEAGGTATFTVKLGLAPATDVVLDVTSADTGEGTVSPATLTFTSANWNTNQTVTITGVDDSIIDGNISYNVTVAVDDGNSDDAYDAVADSTVSVTNNDNDLAALVIGAVSGATTEAGGTATFTVKLGAGPSSDVVLDITSTDTGEGTVSPATLTFTSANWNTNQTVTVTGVDDSIIDGNITYDVTVAVNDGSSNDSYDSVSDSQVSITNNDNDSASLIISAISGTIDESGTSATFTVRLGAGPTSDVVLNISSTDTGEGTVSPSTLTFTSANWNTDQTVTVTGVDDAIVDGSTSFDVTVAVNDGSSNDDYDGVADSLVSVSNDDDDTASMVIGAISGHTTEAGGTATFTVKLGAGPLSDVVIDLSSADVGEGTISPLTLTFTAANWNTNQTVTVTGVDDSIIDGAISFDINLVIDDLSSANSYDGVVDGAINVTNDDNDSASFVIGAVSAATTEAGGTATFTVKLGAGPSSDVVLDITSQDTGEGTVSPATLTFTSANWNTNQTVTVTGVDDSIIDGNIAFNVTVAVDDGNSNNDYDALADSQVAVTNNDDDSASLVIGAISGNTSETGTTATFTIKLGKGPLTDVVLDITSADTGEGTVSPATLTFTSANWNTNQTVTVTGVDDGDVDGDITYNVTVAVNDGSSHDSYDAVANSTVAVTNDDDDGAVATYTSLATSYSEVNTNAILDISDDRTLGVYVKAGSVYLWDFVGHTSTLVSKLPNDSAANGSNPRISGDGSTVVYQSNVAIDPADTNGFNDIYSYDVGSDTNTKITTASTTPVTQSSGDGGTCGRAYTTYLYCDPSSNTPGDTHEHNTSTGGIFVEYTVCAELENPTVNLTVQNDIGNPSLFESNETIYSYNDIIFYQNPDTNFDGSIIVYEKHTSYTEVDYTYSGSDCATTNIFDTVTFSNIAKYIVATESETEVYSGTGAISIDNAGTGNCPNEILKDRTNLEKPSISPDGNNIAYYTHIVDVYDGGYCGDDIYYSVYASINGIDYSLITSAGSYTYGGATYGTGTGGISHLTPIAMDNSRVVFGAASSQYTANSTEFALYCDSGTYEFGINYQYVVGGGNPDVGADYTSCQVFQTGQNTGNFTEFIQSFILVPEINTYLTRLRSLKHNGTIFTSSSTLDFDKIFNINRVDLNPVRDEIVFQSPVDNTNVTDTNTVADVYRAKLNMTGLEVLSKHSDGVTQSNAASGATVFFTEDGTAVDFTTSATNLDATNSSPPMLTRKQIDPL